MGRWCEEEAHYRYRRCLSLGCGDGEEGESIDNENQDDCASVPPFEIGLYPELIFFSTIRLLSGAEVLGVQCWAHFERRCLYRGRRWDSRAILARLEHLRHRPRTLRYVLRTAEALPMAPRKHSAIHGLRDGSGSGGAASRGSPLRDNLAEGSRRVQASTFRVV